MDQLFNKQIKTNNLTQPFIIDNHLYYQNPVNPITLTMKPLLLAFIILFMIGCEDSNEDIHRYLRNITQTKEYPVYLDMSEIGNIQVTAKPELVSPFKIVSNDKFYFIGDMLKGIHVYEKKAGGVNYLCFIACKYIKDFDYTGNRLFCNNFTDLVVLDVSDPTKTKVLYREKNHFNRYSSYKESWNIPYVEGKGLIVGKEIHSLSGKITERELNLDFTEYDRLYGNLTTKTLPANWFSDHPENDKPYVGIVREVDLWTTPSVNFAPPYYYSDAAPVRMYFEDNVIYILGYGNNTGYGDCIIYNESYPLTYHLYFPSFMPRDIKYMPGIHSFFVLSGQSIWGALKNSNPTNGTIEKYYNYDISTNATSLFLKGNNVITLGSKLSVYLSQDNEQLELMKVYPDISGDCYSASGNILSIANTKGLFLYDISDLENIKPIP